jgi:hypothetical protein
LWEVWLLNFLRLLFFPKNENEDNEIMFKFSRISIYYNIVKVVSKAITDPCLEWKLICFSKCRPMK